MTIESLSTEIESPEFAARLNLANNLHEFFLLLESEKCVPDLLNACGDLAFRQMLAEHVIRIVERMADKRFENPADTAIAVYLWALSLHDSTISPLLAEKILELQRIWWSRKIALPIANRDSKKSTDTKEVTSAMAEATTNDDAQFVSESISVTMTPVLPSTDVIWIHAGAFIQLASPVTEDALEKFRYKVSSSAVSILL